MTTISLCIFDSGLGMQDNGSWYFESNGAIVGGEIVTIEKKCDFCEIVVGEILEPKNNQSFSSHCSYPCALQNGSQW